MQRCTATAVKTDVSRTIDAATIGVRNGESEATDEVYGQMRSRKVQMQRAAVRFRLQNNFQQRLKRKASIKQDYSSFSSFKIWHLQRKVLD